MAPRVHYPLPPNIIDMRIRLNKMIDDLHECYGSLLQQESLDGQSYTKLAFLLHSLGLEALFIQRVAALMLGKRENAAKEYARPNETSDSWTSINTDIANMATTYLSNLIKVRNTAWNIVSEADKYGGDEYGPHKCVSRFWTPEYYAWEAAHAH